MATQTKRIKAKRGGSKAAAPTTSLTLDPSKLDFSQMTRDQKLALLDQIEEKKRRIREKRSPYIPNTGQLQVHSSTALNRFVFSGNGSGKSALLVQEAWWAAEGYNPVLKTRTNVPAQIAVVLDSPPKVEDVWLPEIRKWFNLKESQLFKNGKPYYNSISFDNGSQIQFYFHDQAPMVFESIQTDFVIFDEPSPRPIFVALKRGGRKQEGMARYLLGGTPIAAAWLRTDVYDKWIKGELLSTECFRFSTTVNEKNLATGYIDQFSSYLSEKEKRIRLEGEFFDLEGLALAHLFKRDVHVIKPIEWNYRYPVVVAIDFHPAKKHTAVMVGSDPWDRIYAIKEFSSKSPPAQLAQELKKWYSGYRVIDIIVDSLGSSPMTGGNANLSFIESLNLNGIRCRATRFKDKSEEDWIDRIQSVLLIPEIEDNMGRKEPQLKFFEGCRQLIQEVETVQWQKYRNIDEYKPSLDIGAKDMLSCLKYALSCNLTFMRSNAKVLKTLSRDIGSKGILG